MSLKIGSGDDAVPIIVAVAGDAIQDLFVINGVNLETKVIKNIHQCMLASLSNNQLSVCGSC